MRDYLNSLIWDGNGRLDTWLVEYADADATEHAAYVEEIGAKFLISAVARIFEPGCKVDHVLVFEGAQAIGKSTMLSILAGDQWFSDNLSMDLGNKDSALHLRGKWIIEMSELAQLQRSSAETVKAYITRRTDKYRPPYGRVEVEVQRQCVFTASTNSDAYLVDDTGNRRFWPVRCGEPALPRLRQDRDQLWAEAVARYQAGEPWHITDKDIKAAAAEVVESRTAEDPWTRMVADALKLVGDDGITPGEVLDKIYDLRPADKTKGAANRVSSVLRQLGWRRGKRHRTRGQLYHQPHA